MRRSHLGGIGWAGLALIALAWPQVTWADPIAPAALVPALEVYTDHLAFGHTAAAVCGDPKLAAPDDNGWPRAKSVLLATLWANGFPADAVRDFERRLEAPAPAAKPDCSDPAVLDSFSTAQKEGWVMAVSRAIGGMDLAPVSEPVAPGQWQAIKDAISADLPKEVRVFDCLAVTTPELMPVVVHDWDAMIAKIGGQLVAAGLPRDEVATVLSAAEANSIWHRAAPDAAAALRTSCDADESWSDRMYNLEFLGLGDTVAKLLPPSPPDSGNN